MSNLGTLFQMKTSETTYVYMFILITFNFHTFLDKITTLKYFEISSELFLVIYFCNDYKFFYNMISYIERFLQTFLQI